LVIYILTKTGKVVVRKSVWALSQDDLPYPDMKLRLVDLDEGISSKIGDGLRPKDINPKLMDFTPEVPDDLFDDEDEIRLETGDPDSDKPEDFTPESYNKYLTVQVLLPQGGVNRQRQLSSVKRKTMMVDQLESAMQIHCGIPICTKLNFQIG
jgi:hypothetical protein